MSHSCLPNAFWYYEGDKHVLRARSDIAIGDEVCISYLSEDWLLRSGPERRWDLHQTKHFWCTCQRCNGESDFSRGFVCPRCRSGIVFGPAPGCGPAKSQQPPRGDLFSAVCGKCGHRITKAEAAKLSAQEKALQTLVDRLDSSSDQQYATEVSDFIEAVFAQHWLADVAWEKLVDFYKKGMGGKRRRTAQSELLQRRCRFHEAAYPGLSGQHAWALEAYADFLCSRGREHSRSSASPEECKDASRLYLQALRILRLMYGNDQEQTLQVQRKLSFVRVSVPNRCCVRRRLSGKQPAVE